MFGKGKDKDGNETPAKSGADENQAPGAAPPLEPFSKKGAHAPAIPQASQTRAEIPRRVVDIPGVQRHPGRPVSVDDEANKLTVGRNICLAGEITSCQKLVVEGRVEASLTDARIIEIAPSGYFKGSAEVDEADISGLFEGDLTARDKLVIRKSGRVTGTVRYGRIVIESGGEISGDMAALEESAKPEMPTAPNRRPPANTAD